MIRSNQDHAETFPAELDHGPADQQLPPCDLDAERCLLGSIMLAGDNLPAVMAKLRGRLTHRSFYVADHQIIFEAMERMHESRRPVDAITLRHQLEQSGQLQEIGGAGYLAEIVATQASYRDWQAYADIVADKSMARRLIALADTVKASAYGPHDSALDIVTDASRGMAELLQSGAGDDSLLSIDDVVGRAIDQTKAGGIDGVPWGLPLFDRGMDIGLGEIAVLAARPSVGKSMIAKQVAWHAATNGHPVLFVSLEENAEKIGRNWLSSQLGITNEDLRAGNVSPDLYGGFDDARKPLKGVPLYFDFKANTVRRLEAAVASAKHRHDTRLLILDYLQLLQPNLPANATRYAEVTAASLAIARIVRENNVAALILAQINRAGAQRDGRPPTMQDLKDSGQIEQDADQIVIMHRPGFDAESDDRKRKIDFIIAKKRDGRRDVGITLGTDLRHQRVAAPADLGLQREHGDFDENGRRMRTAVDADEDIGQLL